MSATQVLVVSASAVLRAELVRLLAGGGFAVAGEAAGVEAAVLAAADQRPGLILVDLAMPHAVTAIERIMVARGVPILAIEDAAKSVSAAAAVTAGALAAMPRPAPATSEGFLAQARLLAGVPVITRYRPRRADAAADGTSRERRIFGIAASTGGPQALAEILAGLPETFPAPILIAQHIADGFAGGVAQWLDSLCQVRVVLAAGGESPAAGTAYLSPSETSLHLDAKGRMMLAPRGDGERYHPSCDMLLTSLAAAAGRHAVGIILTGMGGDGVAGMARIRAAGGTTIGQDEASSVIYGMNRAAIEAGHVGRVLPLARIAEEMTRLAGPAFVAAEP